MPSKGFNAKWLCYFEQSLEVIDEEKTFRLVYNRHDILMEMYGEKAIQSEMIIAALVKSVQELTAKVTARETAKV